MLRIISSRIQRVSTSCPVKQFSVAANSDGDKPHYDVIIAGGGLVGVSLAVSLGKFHNLDLFTFSKNLTSSEK